MYNKIIPNHIKTLEIYKRKLLEANVISEGDYETVANAIRQKCDEEFEASKTYVARPIDWKTSYADFESAGMLRDLS